MKCDREQTMRLLKTARGQLDGIVRMVEEDKYCIDISHQLLSCEALLKKTNREILRAHMENCVKEAFECGSREDAERKIGEMVELLGKMA